MRELAVAIVGCGTAGSAAVTRAPTPLFQSDHRWLGPVRDGLFGVTCRRPIARRQMLGMAGIHRGPFRKTMTLRRLPR